MKRKFLSFLLFGLVLVGCSGGQPIDLETAKARATNILNKIVAGEVVSPTAYSIDFTSKAKSITGDEAEDIVEYVYDFENKYAYFDVVEVENEETKKVKVWVYVENAKMFVATESDEEKSYVEGDASRFESYVEEIKSSLGYTRILDPIDLSRSYILSLRDYLNNYSDEEALKAKLPDDYEFEYKFENKSTGEGNIIFNCLLGSSGTTKEGFIDKEKIENKILFDNYLISEFYQVTESYDIFSYSSLTHINFSHSTSINKPNLDNFTKVEQ